MMLPTGVGKAGEAKCRPKEWHEPRTALNRG
jgi:hypothetical protein